MAYDNERDIKAAEEAVISMGESIEKTADLIKESVKESIESLTELGASAKQQGEDFYSDMLESERFYFAEQSRLEEEQARMQEETKRLEYQKRLSAAKNATNREIVEQNEALRRKKLADKEYLEQLKKTAEEEKNIYNQLKAEIKEIYDDIADYAKERIGDVVKSQEKMESKLSDLGNVTRKQIFHGLGKDGGDLVYTIVSDLDPQLEALTKYSDSLKTLKERIYSGGFDGDTLSSILSAINEMSVTDGTAFATELSGLSDEKFADYLSKWVKKQELSESISKDVFSDEFVAAVDDVKDYMVTKLTEAGLKIPEDFSLSGTTAAKNFGDAFAEELKLQMDQIRQMVENFSQSFKSSALKMSVVQAGGGNVNTSTTYILNSSGETVAQQLLSARSHSELERMRNG